VIEAGDVEATARALSQQKLPLPCPKAPRRRRFDDIRPVPRLRLTRLADPGRSSRVDAGEPIAEFSFDYAGHTVSAGDPKKSLAVYHGGAICEYRRHPREESRARERLEAAGLVPAGCMADDRFAPAHTGDWRRFIASAVPSFRTRAGTSTPSPAFPGGWPTPISGRPTSGGSPSDPAGSVWTSPSRWMVSGTPCCRCCWR